MKLNIFTQDRFMFLLKGIEFQLKKYGVVFNYTITNSEKDIYKQLLSTNKNKNTQNWDLLVWGDDVSIIKILETLFLFMKQVVHMINYRER
ncbi:MAG: hypothetical protein U5K55_03485 [Aliarcobacter sp.]|nr:hypothetical protein [Aliarcobacter sp.]